MLKLNSEQLCEVEVGDRILLPIHYDLKVVAPDGDYVWGHIDCISESDKALGDLVVVVHRTKIREPTPHVPWWAHKTELDILDECLCICIYCKKCERPIYPRSEKCPNCGGQPIHRQILSGSVACKVLRRPGEWRGCDGDRCLTEIEDGLDHNRLDARSPYVSFESSFLRLQKMFSVKN